MSLGNRTTNNIRIREIVKLEEEDGCKGWMEFLEFRWKMEDTHPHARSLESGLWNLEFGIWSFGVRKKIPPQPSKKK